MPSRSALSHDVEQALQKAIVQANNAFTSGTDATKQVGKTSKRKHNDTTPDKQSGKKVKRKKTVPKEDISGDEGNVIVAGTSLDAYITEPSSQPGPSKKKLKLQKVAVSVPQTYDLAYHGSAIDPSLQSIRSSLPTNELAAALTRANQEDPGPVPSLAELFDEADDGNENLLRVLSELDLPKVVGVLKNFADSGLGGHTYANIPSSFSKVSHSTVNTTSLLGLQHSTTPRPAPLPMPKWNVAIPTSMNQMLPTSQTEHARLLSTRWMGTAKLAELERESGLVYKKGKFSAIEDNLIIQAIQSFKATRGLSDDELVELIKKKKGSFKDSNDSFWFEITAEVPMRPLQAVYHHVRRMYDRQKHMGKWLAEEDLLLTQAVAELGQRWEDVSTRVGRNASDCRDRWRNHINHKEKRVTGQWTVEEEAEFIKIIKASTTDKGVADDSDVFWSDVSAKLGFRRSRQQCRIKWYDCLRGAVENDGVTPRWTPQDAFILVYKVASLGVIDDSEIDWKNLNDADWNLWGAHQLQRRWKGLKTSIKGHENMTLQDILEILKAKKGTTPPSPSKPWKKRVHTISSAEYVAEEDVADDNQVIAPNFLM